MLARAHRVTSGRDYADTIRRGRRAGTPTAVLHLAVAGEQAAPAAGPLQPRVGVVVGKAVGNAVTRNQVKRRLRPLVRARLDRLPAGAVLIIRALPAAGTASWAVLGRDVDRALDRLSPGHSE